MPTLWRGPLLLMCMAAALAAVEADSLLSEVIELNEVGEGGALLRPDPNAPNENPKSKDAEANAIEVAKTQLQALAKEEAQKVIDAAAAKEKVKIDNLEKDLKVDKDSQDATQAASNSAQQSAQAQGQKDQQAVDKEAIDNAEEQAKRAEEQKRQVEDQSNLQTEKAAADMEQLKIKTEAELAAAKKNVINQYPKEFAKLVDKYAELKQKFTALEEAKDKCSRAQDALDNKKSEGSTDANAEEVKELSKKLDEANAEKDKAEEEVVASKKDNQDVDQEKVDKVEEEAREEVRAAKEEATQAVEKEEAAEEKEGAVEKKDDDTIEQLKEQLAETKKTLEEKIDDVRTEMSQNRQKSTSEQDAKDKLEEEEMKEDSLKANSVSVKDYQHKKMELEHENRKNMRAEERKVEKLESDLEAEKREKEEATQQATLAETDMVSTEQLDREKAKAAAEAADSASAISDASTRAKAEVKRAQAMAAQAIKENNQAADKQEQDAEATMEQAEAREVTQNVQVGEQDSKLNKLINQLGNKNQPKAASLVPQSVAQTIESGGEGGDSVQSLQDKLINIEENDAKERNAQEGKQSTTKVQAEADAQKVKMLFSTVEDAEKATREADLEREEATNELSQKSKLAKKADLELANFKTLVADAELTLAQAGTVQAASEARASLDSLKNQVRQAKNVKETTDAKVNLAQQKVTLATNNLDQKTQTLAASKAQLSHHASSATSKLVTVAQIQANLARDNLKKANEAKRVAEEALDRASAAGDQTASNQITAIAGKLAKKVVEDTQILDQGKTDLAKAETAAAHDIREQASAEAAEAGASVQSSVLKMKLKKVLDQTNIDPEAVSKAESAIASMDPAAALKAAREKASNDKASLSTEIKKLEGIADQQIKEQVAVTVLTHPGISRNKLTEALEVKAKEVIQTMAAEAAQSGKAIQPSSIMKRVLEPSSSGGSQNAQSAANQVVQAAAAGGEQSKGQNSNDSTVSAAANAVAEAKRIQTTAAQSLAEAKKKLAEAKALAAAETAKAAAARAAKQAADSTESKAEGAEQIAEKIGVDTGAQALEDTSKAEQKSSAQLELEANTNAKMAEANVKRLTAEMQDEEAKARQASEQVTSQRQSERAAAVASASEAVQEAKKAAEAASAQLASATTSKENADAAAAQAQGSGNTEEVAAANTLRQVATAMFEKRETAHTAAKAALSNAELDLLAKQSEADAASAVQEVAPKSQALRIAANEANVAKKQAEEAANAARVKLHAQQAKHRDADEQLKNAIQQQAAPALIEQASEKLKSETRALAVAQEHSTNHDTELNVKTQEAAQGHRQAEESEAQEADKQIEAANAKVVKHEKEKAEAEQVKAEVVAKVELAKKSVAQANAAHAQATSAQQVAQKSNLIEQAQMAGRMVTASRKVVLAAQTSVRHFNAEVEKAENRIKVAAENIALAKEERQTVVTAQKARENNSAVDQTASDAINKQEGNTENLSEKLQDAQAKMAKQQSEALKAKVETANAQLQVLQSDLKASQSALVAAQAKSREAAAEQKTSEAEAAQKSAATLTEKIAQIQKQIVKQTGDKDALAKEQGIQEAASKACTDCDQDGGDQAAQKLKDEIQKVAQAAEAKSGIAKADAEKKQSELQVKANNDEVEKGKAQSAHEAAKKSLLETEEKIVKKEAELNQLDDSPEDAAEKTRLAKELAVFKTQAKDQKADQVEKKAALDTASDSYDKSKAAVGALANEEDKEDCKDDAAKNVDSKEAAEAAAAKKIADQTLTETKKKLKLLENELKDCQTEGCMQRVLEKKKQAQDLLDDAQQNVKSIVEKIAKSIGATAEEKQKLLEHVNL